MVVFLNLLIPSLDVCDRGHRLSTFGAFALVPPILLRLGRAVRQATTAQKAPTQTKQADTQREL
jgi:hypothetical protein